MLGIHLQVLPQPYFVEFVSIRKIFFIFHLFLRFFLIVIIIMQELILATLHANERRPIDIELALRFEPVPLYLQI